MWLVSDYNLPNLYIFTEVWEESQPFLLVKPFDLMNSLLNVSSVSVIKPGTRLVAGKVILTSV